MFSVSVAGECEAWEFQGGVVLLVGVLEQYHIGLGGGGKVFQDVELWECGDPILSWRIAKF